MSYSLKNYFRILYSFSIYEQVAVITIFLKIYTLK